MKIKCPHCGYEMKLWSKRVVCEHCKHVIDVDVHVIEEVE